MEFFPDSKVILSIGSLTITWYAICILTGALLAYLWGQYNFKKLGYDKEILSDYFFSVLAIGIIGARIWYVIFMWRLYADDLAGIFRIYDGGLAIQGGLVAGIIFSIWFFRKKNVDFLLAGDIIMPVVLIAQACGRWGNFFNQEAHGGMVSLDFLQSLHLPNFIIEGMHINGFYYHPTFLYESVGCVIGFLLIVFVVKKFQKKQGTLFFSYFIYYGVLRFFVESLRTDSLYVFGFRTAQVFSVVTAIAGVIGIVYFCKRGKDIKQI